VQSAKFVPFLLMRFSKHTKKIVECLNIYNKKYDRAYAQYDGTSYC
jgi:hypothetical protein